MDEGQDDLIVGFAIVLWLVGWMIGFQSLTYLNLSVDFQYPRSPPPHHSAPPCLLEEGLRQKAKEAKYAGLWVTK